MSPETLEALKASIAKWERNAVAETWEDFQVGSENCALCHIFVASHCGGCPIFERTFEMGCHGTPYYRAAEARAGWRDGYWTREAAQTAAREEVAFLKSLLPPEEQVP